MYKKYKHHPQCPEVWVDEDLKGKHRDLCLCYRCNKFQPEDRLKNCRIANAVFDNCVGFCIVTPVMECPDFERRAHV